MHIKIQNLIYFFVQKLSIDDGGSESETEDGPDVDELDFFDDIKMNDEDARAIEMFQNRYISKLEILILSALD